MVTNWQSTTLGEHIELATGEAFKSAYFGTTPDSGTLLARGDNVKEGVFEWGEKARYWPTLTSDLERYLLAAGDILVGMDGSKVGKNWVQVRERDLPCLLVQRVARLRTKQSLDQGFLRFLIGNPTFRNYIDAVKTGSAIPHISGRQIKDYPINLPPLSEQKAIARILGTLDDKIELNRRMNATLEAIARALFQSWLETHEAEIEQHSVQSLIDTRTLLIGDGYRAKNSEMGSGGLPFVRAGNLREDGLDLSGAEILGPEGVKAAGHKLGQAGDVAFTSKGTVGRITRVAPKTGRFVYSPQVCFWRSLVPEKLHPNVLYRWMSTDGFMRQVDAVSRQTDMAPYVSLQDQRKMVIQLPPTAAQQTIAKQLQPIDEMIAANAEQSRTLITLRDTLLPKLLSGELKLDNFQN